MTYLWATYLWAYAAGILTLVNPCVLPLLPIVIAAAFQSSRSGPLMLAVGLTLSFTVIGVGVTAFGHLAGIDDEAINRTAAVIMVVFGVILLVPRAQAVLARIASPVAGRANAGIDRVQGAGAAGQLAGGRPPRRGVVPVHRPPPSAAPSDSRRAARASGQAGFTMLAFGIGSLHRADGPRPTARGRSCTPAARSWAAWMPWAKPIMGAFPAAGGRRDLLPRRRG